MVEFIDWCTEGRIVCFVSKRGSNITVGAEDPKSIMSVFTVLSFDISGITKSSSPGIRDVIAGVVDCVAFGGVLDASLHVYINYCN